MKLKDLVGFHELSGVEMIKDGDKTGIAFILNDFIHFAIEDEQNGYRSSMEEIYVTVNIKIKNKFPPIPVKVRYVEEYDGCEADMIIVQDVIAKRDILYIGTRNTDDYYPWFCAEFHPEEMCLNAKKFLKYGKNWE